ncbi:PadR family transcriptional regulator [Sphaerisporangium album]|uniref:PadR family transcriptional regulator n=1 Tax=Sphaerisporangium album TaxID=509200 RepID=A0A367FR35_9ACTN|nr:PadR family transcriptional regulator [Sphaerisporangium album]RCG32369.1 PadR family transcriptional regulator [Sphaerisporangium album]
MSPVFAHGRLRLYLLKLLEESPRHGYEVIRLLQDRFLGVYSPSPGTIYPRLARLEEEGLVTHEVVEGKKVFTITDKGRAELEARMDELAELEQEISESVRDIAREVKEDVRDTVRSLRDELTQMAREVRQGSREDERQAKDDLRSAREDYRRAWREQKRAWQEQKQEFARQKQSWKEESQRWKQDWLRGLWGDTWQGRGSRDHDAELGQMLAEFVEEIRGAAAASSVTEEALATAQDALYEAATRIRSALR